MWRRRYDATPFLRWAEDVRMDLISAWPGSSSLSAPLPNSSPPSQTVQKVISGRRRLSRSRACTLSGGECRNMSWRCSRRSSCTSGPLRSSIFISTNNSVRRALGQCVHRQQEGDGDDRHYHPHAVVRDVRQGDDGHEVDGYEAERERLPEFQAPPLPGPPGEDEGARPDEGPVRAQPVPGQFQQREPATEQHAPRVEGGEGERLRAEARRGARRRRLPVGPLREDRRAEL